VADLGATTYLDSTALYALVQIAQQAAARGGWLRLASVDSPMVRRIVEITRLETFLGDYPNVENAIQDESQPGVR
jgi:anti-anti-sigma factor